MFKSFLSLLVFLFFLNAAEAKIAPLKAFQEPALASKVIKSNFNKPLPENTLPTGLEVKTVAGWSMLFDAHTGDPKARLLLGLELVRGNHFRFDLEVGLYWLHQAALELPDLASLPLGVIYANRLSSHHDEKKAKYWLEQAAKTGQAQAQYSYAEFLFKLEGSSNSTYTKAIALLDSAAKQDHPRALLVLARLHFLTAYEETGIALLRKSASLGLLEGIVELAAALEAKGDRTGSIDDYAEALRWYVVAARQDSAYAKYKLWVFQSSGKGVTANPKAAVEWLRDSAKDGYAVAQRILGEMILKGDLGLPRNIQKGLGLLREAAIQGDEAALRHFSSTGRQK